MLTQQKVVALVEDDPSVLKGLQRLLSAQGFETERFTSAEAFLDGAAASKASCLVLDIHLGGMSGIELRRRLAVSGSTIPVIFMTAFDDESTQREAVEAGCIAYLHKPFSANLLIAALEMG
jgi:FixJ family two-component response regulator